MNQERSMMQHLFRRFRPLARWTTLATSLGVVAALSADDWPQWRGPDRSNVSRQTDLLEEWPAEGPPLLGTVTGLGEGITAMAVANGVAYTLGYREDAEFLFAIEAAAGKSRWVAPVGIVSNFRSGAFNSLMRWLSPRVPTVDGDRIYSITWSSCTPGRPASPRVTDAFSGGTRRPRRGSPSPTRRSCGTTSSSPRTATAGGWGC